MNVVLRAHGMRFVIFVDDHEPAHVHVRGDGRLKIDISQSPVRIMAGTMKDNDMRRALDTAEAHRQEFLAA